MDSNGDILEIVTFIKDKMVTKDELASELALIKNEMTTKSELTSVKSELKRDIQGLYNRLDDELDKRKALEVRLSYLES